MGNICNPDDLISLNLRYCVLYIWRKKCCNCLLDVLDDNNLLGLECISLQIFKIFHDFQLEL